MSSRKTYVVVGTRENMGAKENRELFDLDIFSYDIMGGKDKVYTHDLFKSDG